MPHCEMLQAGEIQAVVGDAARNGVGGPQYCGLWSLTSQHRVFNAFGNSYAGLIPGEIRGKAPVLEAVDEQCVRLRHAPSATRPVAAVAEYRVAAPYYVDHTLTICDEKDVRHPQCDFREVSWCCYMNCPADPRLHFRSGGTWVSYLSPKHGEAANLAPAYVPNAELERWPARTAAEPGYFHWDRAALRFDDPFYYGRVGEMVLILIFRDHPRWLRFFCSPSGGGGSLFAGQTCPAWDFEWVVPAAAYAVGREYRFRLRLVYKRFVSNDDVLAEVAKAREE